MDSDYILAKQLQEQFNRENKENKSTNVAKLCSPGIKSVNSLADEAWETIDPNPDIIQLFRVFNLKFFWNTLGCVEVKWSPRMYSCAGICTYKGIRGCIVSLSLPLLKYRPRKDLVDTLLHEMIHAYLFITKNNRDRDGHGPEFHKHMLRINKEAGTTITVYHSFHDEVNFYKTHVWRCDGVCRFKKPYFGLVRRAMNRAPGPNDFWFGEHQKNCGGSFIKIQEPENFRARKKKTDVPSSIKKSLQDKQTDLRNFVLHTVTPVKKDGLNSKKPRLTRKPKKTEVGLINYFPSTSHSPRTSSINSDSQKEKTIIKNAGVSSIGSDSQTGSAIMKHEGPSNVFGFTKLSEPSKRVGGQAGSSGGWTKGGGGTKMSNRGGTLLERPRDSPSQRKAEERKEDEPFQAFSGKGYMLTNSGNSSRGKSRLLDLYPPTPVIPLQSDTENIVSCPVCSIPVISSSINEHLDECSSLESVFESTSLIVLDSDDDECSDDESQCIESKVKCPKCFTQFSQENINEHLDFCLSN